MRGASRSPHRDGCLFLCPCLPVSLSPCVAVSSELIPPPPDKYNHRKQDDQAKYQVKVYAALVETYLFLQGYVFF